jgi:hypothetical protein
MEGGVAEDAFRLSGTGQLKGCGATKAAATTVLPLPVLRAS